MVHGLLIIHSICTNWRIRVRKPCKRLITPNASSPKINLYLRIVRWQRICAGHRRFYGTLPDNNPFYLWQLEDSWAQVRALSFLWFYWCCARNQKIELQLPGERELLPENSVKSWYQYNWGVNGKKAFSCNIQRALKTGAAAVVLKSKLSISRNACAAGAGIQTDRKFEFIWF